MGEETVERGCNSLVTRYLPRRCGSTNEWTSWKLQINKTRSQYHARLTLLYRYYGITIAYNAYIFGDVSHTHTHSHNTNVMEL